MHFLKETQLEKKRRKERKKKDILSFCFDTGKQENTRALQPQASAFPMKENRSTLGIFLVTEVGKLHPRENEFKVIVTN